MKTLLRLLAAVAVLAELVLLYAWGGERPRLRVQRYRLALPEGAGAGLRILHLSDQHFAGDSWVRRSRLRHLWRLLAPLHPHLIVLTGDFLHNDTGFDAVADMLQCLPEAPMGRFAVLGNHDYSEYSWRQFFGGTVRALRQAPNLAEGLGAAYRELRAIGHLLWQILRNDRLRFARVANDTAGLRALLARHGVRLMDNVACPLPGTSGLWLAGVDDLVEGTPDLAAALASIPVDAPVILLTHNPDLAYDIPPGPVVLALAGHTHGGQVVLPGLGAVHTQGTRLPRTHPAGYFDDLPGGAQMIVSRGMGESIPLRFRCLPEIVVIDLLPAGLVTLP